MLLPGGGYLMRAVVAAENHQVEDVFLEAAAAKAGAGLEELGTQARIGAGGFAEGGDAVDRAGDCVLGGPGRHWR